MIDRTHLIDFLYEYLTSGRLMLISLTDFINDLDAEFELDIIHQFELNEQEEE